MKRSLSHRTATALVRRACQAGAFTAAAALALVALAPGGCSLGDAVTPQCDPDLPANADGACTQTAACDDGKGGVKADAGCCEQAAAVLMGLCLQDGVGNDWPQSCASGGFLVDRVCTLAHSDVTDVVKQINGFSFTVDVTTACQVGTAIREFCLAGGLEFKENTGGGGSGGNSGGGGSGGSTGGGSTGGNSAGGSGGSGGN